MRISQPLLTSAHWPSFQSTVERLWAWTASVLLFPSEACQAHASTSVAVDQPLFPSPTVWLAQGLGVSAVGGFSLAKSELFRRDGHFMIELHISLKKILMFINFTDFVFLV